MNQNIPMSLYWIISSVIVLFIGMTYFKNLYIKYLPDFKFRVFLKDGTNIQCEELTKRKGKIVLEINMIIAETKCIKKKFIEKPLDEVDWIEAEVILNKI
ncbi:hypothetical protein EDC18_101429 [Natranaerovirga pectinivora]|uniref:Uncharacterized protein n=1 Tax=Natranaerovirga pectinivora TaxID=682400 RepID=A0A4R3MPH5_9FIRM|nr:hypothetical protein [Natranaerovirga pectinivora]TCT17131.1 hypothetical protein EDC18_101429 [Natranaerovirga pectinivora]